MEKYLANGELVIHIKNEQPVEVIDFTNSLSAFVNQYNVFLEDEGVCKNTNAKMYIKQIEKGSIIATLNAAFNFAQQIPIEWAQHGDTLINFVKHLKTLKDLFLGENKDEKLIKKIQKKDCEDIIQILEPIAKDNASQINIAAKNNTVNIYVVDFNSIEANAIQNKAKEIQKQLEEEDSKLLKSQTLIFYQARNGTNNKGDLGIIDTIDTKPKKILFANENIKKIMLDQGIFNHGFKVNVEVNFTTNNKVKSYKVISLENYYPFNER